MCMLKCIQGMAMKKLFLLTITLYLFAGVFGISDAQAALFKKKEAPETPQVEETDFSSVELDVKEEEKLKVQTNEPVKEIKTIELSKDDEEKIKNFQIQKKQDIEDIKKLWEATLERNNVIKFALKKVTMNPEERKKHSSKMARTISALLNGSSILPYAFGLDASIASAIAAGTSLSTQAAKNKLGYGAANIPVTDTELIQLASLIENLQDNLIKNYYAYKSSIELLKDCRAKLAVYDKNHKLAVQANNQANILVTKSMYEKQKIEELKLKNQIKTARIELERFAGEEVVNELNLINANDLKACMDGSGSEL